jgi:hypothetical protein
MARKLIVSLVLLWTLAACGHEAWLAWRARGRTGRVPPALWRLPTRPVEHLRACAEAVRGRLPPRSRVAFLSRPPTEDQFYRWRWAAYLLPEMEVLALTDAGIPETARYVVAYRRGFEDARARPLAEFPGCTLYEVATR